MLDFFFHCFHSVTTEERAALTVFSYSSTQGDSSVFLPLLAKRSTGSATPSSSSSTTTTSLKNKPQVKTVPASRPGRAATVFRDLSGTEQGSKLEKTYDSDKTKRGKPAVGRSGRKE